MKNMIIAALFTFSQIAFAGPSGVDVKAGNQMSGMLFKENHSLNAGFEANNENNVTDSSSIATVTSTSPISGNYSLAIDATTSGELVKILGKTIKQVGTSCESVFYYTGDATLYKAYVLQGATKVSQELTLSNVGTNVQPVSLIFPCGAGTAPDVTIESTGNGAAIKVDDFYSGMPINIGTVAQAKFLGSVKYAGATNCVWQRTGTSYGNFSADTDCSTPTAIGDVQAPGTKIPAVVLPNAAPGTYYIIATASFALTSTNQGSYWRFSDGSNVTSGQQIYISAGGIIAGNTYSGQLVYTSPQTNVTINMQGAASAGDAQILANSSLVDLEISVYYFPSQSQTVLRSDQLSWRVDANISGANPSLGTASVASYTGIENSSLTLTNNTGSNVISAQIPCSGTNAPSGTTCSAGNESVGVSFNLPAAQDVLACASFGWSGTTGAGGSLDTAFQIVETPNNAQTISQEGKSRLSNANSIASSSLTFPLRTCGTFTFSSAGQKTLRLMYEQYISGTIANSLLIADANTDIGQRDIHWEVYPLNTLFGAPLLVQSVISDSAGVEKICRATIANSGTASFTTQSGCFTNISRDSGSKIITLTMSGFSGAASCNCTPNGNPTIRKCGFSAPTTSTTVTPQISDNSGNGQDQGFEITCVGPR